LFTDPSAGNLVTRPYTNTFIVAIVSSMIVLFVGSFAAYALTRFEYHPKPGLIGSFIGCGALTGLLIISLGVAWYWAVLIGLVLFGIIAQTIGRKFKGAMNNDDVAFWLISQRMLPPVAVILPIYMMFSKLGLLDTLFAIIVVYIASHLPLVIWFMRDYIMTIPLELEESAFIDGASRFVVMYKVILPLAVPGLVATFLIVLIFAWNEYILALFLSTANAQTMPVLVAAQNATRGPQWWNISMLVMMMVAPIIIMAFFLERFIAKGILMGAVKG